MARRKKTTDEQPVEVPSTNTDDNFGLPDIEYQPLDRAAEPESKPEMVVEEAAPTQSHFVEEPVHNTISSNTYESSYSPVEASGSSRAPMIIGIIVVVLAALGATWYFAVYKPQKVAEAKALSEKNRKDAEAKEQARLAEEQRLEEERRRAAEAAANAKPAEGTIETLGDRTGRYYVVAASSIDADLVMDYAKELSAKGTTVKIIPPYGKIKFSRLTVAEGDTYANTQKLADGLKGEYTDALWVIKY
jgi:hypothetical protein